MADRELKRLSRRELLEMLIAQGRENERLQAEITQLEDRLNEREIRLAKSGNIAEAALRLNGIFEAAQKAAEQYLENVSKGDITKALIGDEKEFIIVDAEPPEPVWDETDLSDPEPAESESEAPLTENPAEEAPQEAFPAEEDPWGDFPADIVPPDATRKEKISWSAFLDDEDDDLGKPWLPQPKRGKPSLRGKQPQPEKRTNRKRNR